jgi:hypothetical protein
MIEIFVTPSVGTSNTTHIHILTVIYKFVPVAITSTEVWRCTGSGDVSLRALLTEIFHGDEQSVSRFFHFFFVERNCGNHWT